MAIIMSLFMLGCEIPGQPEDVEVPRDTMGDGRPLIVLDKEEEV